jgi:GNAT superfamily N-acetyltransferase
MEAGNDLIRHALPGEAAALTDLALRSKAHWGYDEEFLESCRADLTLAPGYIAASPVFVLEEDGARAGFYGLLGSLPAARLEYLFVEPAWIGRGFGERLWRHAVETATAAGFTELEIESDPGAEGFYLAMGARRIGEAASLARPGRKLPILCMHLPVARGR